MSAPIPLTFYVNPKLSVLDRSPKSKWPAHYESCESVPNYNALVRRAQHVKLDAWNLNGEDVSVNAFGILARMFQHEVDHLNGVAYTDIMEEKTLRHDKYIDVYDVKRT